MIGRIGVLLSFSAAACWAQAADGAAFYKEKVRPILVKNCAGCHNATVKQAGFDLSTRAALLLGSDNGPVVTPGDPGQSLLFKLISHAEQPNMPFKGKKLPDDAIAVIETWIKNGVPYDSNEQTSTAKPEPAPVKVDHWAFQKPVKPDVPKIAGMRNPVDAFLEPERVNRKLQPSPEADRGTLLRRLYIDLIGLVPSPAEVDAFIKDKSPGAYEKVVDRLLASPRYGERWGRHWLDVWRYSDWYGWRKENQVRYSQRHIWRWRDWVVESVNKNKGYDQMIREMLAGDEIAPNDPDTLRATGYLARSWYRFNRNVWLQEAAEYTATSFLGLTMKCARCHTHKYDPIMHVDYYRFRAFFEPYEVRTDRVPGQPDILKAGEVRAYDADASTPTYRFVRGNESAPEKDKPLTPGLPAFFGAKLDIKPIPLSIEARYPDGREFVRPDLIREAEATIEKAEVDLEKARAETSADLKARNAITAAEKHLASAEAALPALKTRIAADRAKYGDAADLEKLAAESRKLERTANVRKAEEELFHANRQMEEANGNEKKLSSAKTRLEAAVKALSDVSESYTPVGKIYPETSSGRRLALAQWITAKDNPLTARVAVNHIWLRHFGKALVPTVFNFGKSGKAPSHPQLLDWLATEFMDSGWDMKRIHRLIVTSSAYKMTSQQGANNPNVAIDPDNTYLWRMNPRRMEAEAVRDSLLQIAGKLDTTMGGPEIEETKGQEVFRRSIYFRHTPDLQMEMLQVFDLANPNECFERTQSVMPQQALALANSGLSYSMARMVAGTLVARTGSDTAETFIASAFRSVLGRLPTAVETTESGQFLTRQAALYKDQGQLAKFTAGEAPLVKASENPEQRARESLVHVLLNHNDFVTIR